jgi:transposase
MLPASVRIFVCTVPQDMRRSFDTLALAVQQLLGQDPQSGSLYVFVGKRPTRVKILWWDRNGYCLLAKRLHRSLFRIPETGEVSGSALSINSVALAQLLAGVSSEGGERVIRAEFELTENTK